MPAKRLWGVALAVAMFVAANSPVLAEADGPDAWDVTGVPRGDALNLRTEPNASSRLLARIPRNAKGLKNLGCRGLPNFEQWSRMTAAERNRAARARWCKVQFNGRVGWVAGRFLKESVGQAATGAVRRFGKWSMTCSPGCALDQIGVGASRRTLFRLDQRQGNNARITIERDGLPDRGLLTFHIDGEQISQGPIASFRAKDGRSLVMQPDDLTANLVKAMQEGKTLVVNLPGDERGVEIELDNFIEGWRELGG